MEVELVVAGADDHLAALLGEVGDAGVKLDVAVILQRLAQMDELGSRRTNAKKNETPTAIKRSIVLVDKHLSFGENVLESSDGFQSLKIR